MMKYKQRASHWVEKNGYVIYLIVDETKRGDYCLRCVNKKDIFMISRERLVLDNTILFGLHPIQSCFIGMEAAKHPVMSEQTMRSEQSLAHVGNILNRYGCYTIHSVQRDGKMVFYRQADQQRFALYPDEIVKVESFISEFDSSQAFYIGYSAGQRQLNLAQRSQPPKLYRVK